MQDWSSKSPSQRARGGLSLWHARGRKWRYAPEDEWRNPHWDYDPWNEGPNTKWQNLPIGDVPPHKLAMEALNPFVVFVTGFDFGADAILLLATHETLRWLRSQFERLGSTGAGSSCPPFTIGDGHPIDSDERLFVVVELNDQAGSSSKLLRESESNFVWSISRASARRYRNLLSGMLLPDAGHQYLEPDNCPPAPTVIVSLGEYEVSRFRRPQNG